MDASTTIIPAVTVYCVDCNQELCVCSFPQIEGSHDVEALDELPSLFPSDGQAANDLHETAKCEFSRV